MKKQLEHTKNGKVYIIRQPLENDAEDLAQYMNELSIEKTYIVFQGEQMTKEETLEYVKRVRENVRNKKEVCLLLFFEKELIGMANVALRQKIYKHIGNTSITIKKQFRGKGLGELLIERLFSEASRLIGIKKIVLQVFGNNIPAVSLYRKIGFKEYGHLPKAIKWRGKYVDEILMYKDINKH